MSYAIGVIAFVVALLTSVMLHEAGHFLTAKRYGMKATRFFVGFGPTLWSTRRGETEYGVKAIPAGGFVKIVGMTPLEELEPGDEDRAFYKQPPGQRLVVLAAGSVIHLLLAVFLLFAIIASYGDPLHSRPVPVVDSTTACVITHPKHTACGPGDPVAPARGVLRGGDRITAIDGHRVASYNDVTRALQANPGRLVTMTVIRSGHPVRVQLTPVPVPDGKKTIGRVGFYPRVDPVDVGVGAAVPRTFATIGTLFTSTVHALGDLPHQISEIIHDQPRDNGAAGVVDIAKISGQIAQAHISIGARVANFLLIVAQVNFFVGIFNLLPLLPLDGGHIGILLFEEGRRKVYRLLRRPAPGRVDLMKIMPVTYAVVAVFVGLSLLLLYAGIVNPIRIQ